MSSFLVEDIGDKEQKLFKLDSILSAVGIEGEADVLRIIRDSLASSRDGNVNRESTLKAIRGRSSCLLNLLAFKKNFFAANDFISYELL
jgi:hypothetical protein